MYTPIKLPYSKDSLHYLSAEQIGVHYKIYESYIEKMNEIDRKVPLMYSKLTDIIKWAGEGVLFNTAAQIYNHEFYWNSMKPPMERGGASMSLQGAIEESFMTVENMMDSFIYRGKTHFASGWIWLVVNPTQNDVQIRTTPDASNPLANGLVPLLACDIWEHSYFLDFKSDRELYLTDFITKLANWEFASRNYEQRSEFK